jgi:chloramphenicol O-acetyltransferase type A
MPTYLDLAAWPRRQHFELYRGYDNPFFNVCVPVDVTAMRELVRAEGLSFFIASLYLSTRAANAVEPFRYRLRGDRVLIHEVIHPGSTVLLPDDTFTFAHFEFSDDFDRFHAETAAELERLRSGPQDLRPGHGRDDLIHYSVLPWLAFTSFAHARNWGGGESVPKIMFGKYVEQEGRFKMPVSVEVHHALMDGLHVGRYFERFEADLAAPETALRS